MTDELTHRYEANEAGRLVGDRSGGRPPRFVFARSAEGCIWRFRSDVERERVLGIAKLAGRERGFERPDPATSDAQWSPALPERLVMIARLLGSDREPASFVREAIFRKDAMFVEIWVFD